MTHYEAWDTTKDYCIFYGSHESSLILELGDYIEYQNHIDDTLISDMEIKTLDREALNRLGIKIYIVSY